METSGHESSGGTEITWAMPTYTEVDQTWCRLGLHRYSRKRVVWGYLNYFTSIERWYCACGRHCWIKYEGHFVEKDVTDPGAHLRWIEGHVRMQKTMDLHRAWEQSMSDGHPCWGEWRKCISCGCSEDRPCVSHQDRSKPTFDSVQMDAARARQRDLRAKIWSEDHAATA